MTIKAGELIATKGGKPDPAAFTVDTTKTPYQIDLTARRPMAKTS